MNATKRYSDEELAIFKTRIEQKLEEARTDLQFLIEQIEDITETRTGEGDWMDDTSNNNDLEMVTTMAARQRKHINDLENALLRIRNKSYGICVVTGTLIDSRRLMAVPTTTKCLEAKNIPPVEEKKKPLPVAPKGSQQKIITKIIRKNPVAAPSALKNIIEDDEEDDENYDDYMDDMGNYLSDTVVDDSDDELDD